jgi:hypothetical protein
VKETVIFPVLPQVIQFAVEGPSEGGTQAPAALQWQGKDFDLVGWLEEAETQYVGKVVVDDVWFGSDAGQGLSGRDGEDYNLLPLGRVDRLFYLRRI